MSERPGPSPATHHGGNLALFTATVRAPITGIVLATELTGVTNQLPPTLGACAIAMLVAMTLAARLSTTPSPPEPPWQPSRTPTRPQPTEQHLPAASIEAARRPLL